MQFRLSLVEKASGKVGSYGVGFLNVLTDEFYEAGTDADDSIDIPRTNFSVIRITKDIAAGSRIGGPWQSIKTNSEITIAQVASTSNIDPMIVLNVRGMWARTFEPGMSGQNNAWYLGSRWQNNRFRLEGAYTDIDDDFQSRRRICATQRHPQSSWRGTLDSKTPKNSVFDRFGQAQR